MLGALLSGSQEMAFSVHNSRCKAKQIAHWRVLCIPSTSLAVPAPLVVQDLCLCPPPHSDANLRTHPRRSPANMRLSNHTSSSSSRACSSKPFTSKRYRVQPVKAQQQQQQQESGRSSRVDQTTTTSQQHSRECGAPPPAAAAVSRRQLLATGGLLAGAAALASQPPQAAAYLQTPEGFRAQLDR